MKKTSYKKKLLKRILSYSLMAIAIISITTVVSLFTLGYRFNTVDGQFEQYAMVQFNSIPAGATIFIDGVTTNLKTPNKTILKAGEHTILMELEGYRVWSKKIVVESGTLDWLNYILLIPEEVSLEMVDNYDLFYDSIASPDKKSILIQKSADSPILNLIDISAKEIKSKEIIIPETAYSNSQIINEKHNFQLDKWNESGRYVLIKHTYSEKNEWIVIDTENVELTKNITTTFDFVISDIWFASASGNLFYALGSTEIRKLDLSAGTISRPLIDGVISFSVYDSKIISYVGENQVDGQKTIGLYRDGDDNPYIVKNVVSTTSNPVKASFSYYFNEYYLAVFYDNIIEIYNGSFPTVVDQSSSFSLYASIVVEKSIDQLIFSPSGQYLLGRSGKQFISYDIEYKKPASSQIDSTKENCEISWLNENYILSDCDNKLVIREFDGENIHELNTVQAGNAIVLTSNDRYIYSFDLGLNGVGYQLQRILIRI